LRAPVTASQTDSSKHVLVFGHRATAGFVPPTHALGAQVFAAL
jgi:hypothetical protein